MSLLHRSGLVLNLRYARAILCNPYLGLGPWWRVARNNSSVPGKLNTDSIFVISLPITTHKSYVFCNHDKSLLEKSHLHAIPLFNKLEKKVVNLVSKGWQKISTSENSVNKKITYYVRRLLNGVPYEESCLKTFPSKKLMIREIERKAKNGASATAAIVQSQIDNLGIPQEEINPIPLYHPTFQLSSRILKELNEFQTTLASHHKKYSILCAIGIPLTLPIALIPIIPNVPCFYLCYRFYCNIKALVGAKHLEYLLEPVARSKSSDSITKTKHLDVIPLPFLDNVYDSKPSYNMDQPEEQLLLSEKGINEFCNLLNLPQLKYDLRKALRQESHRLKERAS